MDELDFEWSEALGLSYPTCFLKPIPPSRRILTRCGSGKLLGADRAEQHCPMEMTSSPSFWQESPSTWTYRAMSRYLRRHLVRDSEHWVPQFSVSADPQRIADLLRTNHRALLAFAEMLWAHQMEPRVHERRWPYRNPWLPGADPIPGRLTPAYLMPSQDTLPGAPCPLNRAGLRWVEYHAAGFTMMARWREALRQAICVARSCIAKWHSSSTDISHLCDWSAVVQQDGSLHFLGLSANNLGFSAGPFPDKRARRVAFQNAQENGRRELLEVCCGPCLTWTLRDSWYVTAAARPTSNGWRRHRLLGLKDAKPQFWIFQDGGRFTARLCTAKLQTFDETARGAIEALRRCLSLYIRLYGYSVLMGASCVIDRHDRRHHTRPKDSCADAANPQPIVTTLVES